MGAQIFIAEGAGTELEYVLFGMQETKNAGMI